MADLRDEERQRRLLLRFLTQAGNGVGTAVTLAATTLAVTLPRSERDALYGVTVTPNGGTTVWITTKTITGFTVNFGTAAPASATVDYLTFRTE